MKEDEERLLIALEDLNGREDRDFATLIGSALGIHENRTNYILLKWAEKDWWEYGVVYPGSEGGDMSGPLTPEFVAEIVAQAQCEQEWFKSCLPSSFTFCCFSVEQLAADWQRQREEISALMTLMDSVRDAARNRNPNGVTILDFMACWNEQYKAEIERLQARVVELEAEIARLRDWGR